MRRLWDGMELGEHTENDKDSCIAYGVAKVYMR